MAKHYQMLSVFGFIYENALGIAAFEELCSPNRAHSSPSGLGGLTQPVWNGHALPRGAMPL